MSQWITRRVPGTADRTALDLAGAEEIARIYAQANIDIAPNAYDAQAYALIVMLAEAIAELRADRWDGEAA